MRQQHSGVLSRLQLARVKHSISQFPVEKQQSHTCSSPLSSGVTLICFSLAFGSTFGMLFCLLLLQLSVLCILWLRVCFFSLLLTLCFLCICSLQFLPYPLDITLKEIEDYYSVIIEGGVICLSVCAGRIGVTEQ